MKSDCDEDEECVYRGAKDSDGLPHGRGTLEFIDTGARYEGRFVKGEKSGRGCFYFPDGSSMMGSYYRDVLEGISIYSYPDGRTMVAECKNGQLNGPFTEYDGEGQIAIRGWHQNNKRIGQLQVFDAYGAVLWGLVDKESESLTGENIAYVYPDFKHVLVGAFIDGIFKQGRWGTLGNSIDADDMQPEIIVDPDNMDTVYYDKSTHDCISKFPLVSDRYEKDKVYVSKSYITDDGEGLFTRRFVSHGMVLSFYNGIRLSHEEVDARDWSLNTCTIALDDEVVLDVPHQFTMVEKYCATLGHKVNHSSEPNCKYVLFEHPRFGEIKAIESICDIEKDCELTCDYAYHHKKVDTGEDDLPLWFNTTAK